MTNEMQVPDQLMHLLWALLAVYTIQTAVSVFWAIKEARQEPEPTKTVTDENGIEWEVKPR